MALLLGVVVGLMLGLTGAGGSALAVPLLMWGMDWRLEQAAPIALLTACAAAALGTATSWRVAYVRYRAASLMALTGLIAIPIGHLVAGLISESLLEGLFAAVLALIALRMWLQAGALADEGVVQFISPRPDGPTNGRLFCRLDRRSGRIIWTPACAAGIAGVGAGAGLLAGMFGVGGGFVIVPSLRQFSELSMHSVVATSLMAVAMISGCGATIATVEGQMQPWTMAAPFVAGAVVGMLCARPLAHRFPTAALQRVFAMLAASASAAMALQIR